MLITLKSVSTRKTPETEVVWSVLRILAHQVLFYGFAYPCTSGLVFYWVCWSLHIRFSFFIGFSDPCTSDLFLQKLSSSPSTTFRLICFHLVFFISFFFHQNSKKVIREIFSTTIVCRFFIKSYIRKLFALLLPD